MYDFIYLFLLLVELGLRCRSGFSLVVASGGYSLVAVRGLLIAVAFRLQSTGSRALALLWLWHVGSVVAAPRFQSTG